MPKHGKKYLAAAAKTSDVARSAEDAVALVGELYNHFGVDSLVAEDRQRPVQFVVGGVPGKNRACDLKFAWCSHVLVRSGCPIPRAGDCAVR